MDKEFKYQNLTERKELIEKCESEGLRMLHDNFDSDWKHGDEPHGVMIFTDESESISPMPKDIITELSERLTVIENKLGIKSLGG